MSTWQDIYGGQVDGDPVRAQPAPFQGEASAASSTAQNIDLVNAEFRHIRHGDSEGFRGSTATALAAKAADWQDKLEPAAQVFRDVSRVLSTHADQVTGLQSDTTYAVAQAMAAWRLKTAADARLASSQQSLSSAQSSVSTADHNLAWIRTQIAAIAPGSPDTQFRLPKLNDEARSWAQERAVRISARNNAQAQVDQASGDLATANRELDYWLNGDPTRSWHRLRDREDALNNSTAQRIHNIGLDGVADPGWIREHASDFVDFVRHALDTIKKAVETAVKAFIEGVKLLIKAIAIIVLVIVALVALVALIALAVVVTIALVALALVAIAAVWMLLKVIGLAAMGVQSVMHGAATAIWVWNRYVRHEQPPAYAPGVDSPAGQLLHRISAANGDPNKMKDAYDKDVLLQLTQVANGGGTIPPGYHRLTPSDLGIDPSLLNDPKSGFHAEVFQGPPPNNEIIVAFAGTHESNDWSANFSDTMGGSWANAGSQEREAEALARLVYNQYGDKVIFTGHSLGGDLATVASYATGSAPAVTFNAKGTNLDNLSTMDYAWSPGEIKSYASSHIIAYHTSNDPLTFAQESPLSPVSDVAPDALGNHVTLADGHDLITGHGTDAVDSAMAHDPGFSVDHRISF